MRFLYNEKNGRVLPWTPALNKRPDMRLLDDAEAKRAQEELDAEANARISAAQNPTDESEDVDETAPPPPATLEQILKFRDKIKLEEYGRKYGVELDRRKTLKDMQSILVESLGLS